MIGSRRLLEVVYRTADIGVRWLPSGGGPIILDSLSEEERDRFVGIGSMTLDELRARALAASARLERNLNMRLAARLQGDRAGERQPDPEQGGNTPGRFASAPCPAAASISGREIPVAVETYLQSHGIRDRPDFEQPTAGVRLRSF
jgi:hypothetical protein